MRLSQHFTLQELLRSEAAARHGIKMDPPPQVLNNLERLANEVLEPIRAAVGAAIIVTSGYRPPALNALVGGASESDHLSGRAADFYAHGVDLADLAPIVRATCNSLPVAKLINEYGQWLHVSVEPYGRVPTRRYLIATRRGGKTEYSEWK